MVLVRAGRIQSRRLWLFPPEIERLPFTVGDIRAKLAVLGPLRPAERNTLLVFGTVIALWLAVFESGAARWLAWALLGQITVVPELVRPFVIVMAVAGLHLLFSSNTVTASIIVPILVALAGDLGLRDMARAGLWMTVAAAACVAVAVSIGQALGF